MTPFLDAVLLPSCCACNTLAVLVDVADCKVQLCATCASLVQPKLQQVPLLDLSQRFACFEYSGPIVSLLSKAKDEAFCSQYYALQKMFVAAAGPLISEIAEKHSVVITQVPEAWHRKVKGWYLPAAMARNVARLTKVKYRTLLRRRRQVVKQASLGAVERRLNLKNCFAPQRILFNRNRSQQVVIVIDDVSTTGASLAEAAHCLEAMGYLKVVAISLAIAPLRMREC
ncbi:MAG: putative amidophosphoribosyltransferase [Myxococcota bacterium]|jgi:predicted amidophosphoribosyltransferase